MLQVSAVNRLCYTSRAGSIIAPIAPPTLVPCRSGSTCPLHPSSWNVFFSPWLTTTTPSTRNSSETPVSFRDLLSRQGGIPEKYLPDFSYYKIAVNEIPKRTLVKIRNAVSAIFLVENSRPEELVGTIHSLAQLLKRETPEVIELFTDWFLESQDLAVIEEHAKTINDLMEVTSMWSTAVKEHDSRVKVFEKQEILSDQFRTKFGQSEKANKRIRSTSDAKKLETALKKILSAENPGDVLKCLD